MKIHHALFALIMVCFCSASAQAKALTVMISGGFKTAWETLGPRFAAQEGYSIKTVSGPSMGNTPQAIPARLARGETADVVIMVGDALSDLEKQGRILPGSRVELADSPIGAVIKKGDAPVSIKTVAALRAALLDAPSVAYSDSASGRYVSTRLFNTLGIEKEMQGKAHKVERIPVASQVADGKYTLGFQQVSELLPVPGVTFIGELPASVQYITRFAGAVVITSAHRHEAKDLLNYLASPAVQAVVRSSGLHSVAPVKQSSTVQ